MEAIVTAWWARLPLVRALAAVAVLCSCGQAYAQLGDNVELRGIAGPATICMGPYTYAVNQDEAVDFRTLKGKLDPLTVYVLGPAMAPVTLTTEPDGGTSRPTRAKLANGLEVVKLFYPKQMRSRAGLPFEAFLTTERAHTEYLLPADNQHPAIRIISPGFDEGDTSAILARISPRREQETCTVPPVVDGAGEYQMLTRYSPVATVGPAIVCRDRLLFNIGPGESVQKPMRGFTGSGNDWLVRQGASSAIVWLENSSRAHRPVGSLFAKGFRSTQIAENLFRLAAAGKPHRANEDFAVMIRSYGMTVAQVASLQRRLEFVDKRDMRCAPLD